MTLILHIGVVEICFSSYSPSRNSGKPCWLKGWKAPFVDLDLLQPRAPAVQWQPGGEVIWKQCNWKDTPWKISMEPTNRPFRSLERKMIFQPPGSYVPAVHLPGWNIYFYPEIFSSPPFFGEKTCPWLFKRLSRLGWGIAAALLKGVHQHVPRVVRSRGEGCPPNRRFFRKKKTCPQKRQEVHHGNSNCINVWCHVLYWIEFGISWY